MRLRIVYITILLLCLGLSAPAQKKKAAAKQPSKTQAAAKKKKELKEAAAAKKAKAEKAAKAKKKEKTVTRTTTKDSATLKGATIEILQSYKPEVTMAPKPEVAAALPPVDTSTPVMEYKVPAQSLYYSYNSQPLRPLVLAKDSMHHGFENYIKLGGGNLNTILIDAGIGALHGKYYESAFHLHHTSMDGDIAAGQNIAQTGLEAAAKINAGKNDLGLDLGISRNQYSLNTFSTVPYKAIYTGVRIGADLQPRDRNTLLMYKPAISFLLYGNNNSVSETMFGLDVPVSYQQTEELKLFAGVKGVYDFMPGTLFATQSNYVLQISPGIEYNKGAYSIKLGLYPTVGTNNIYLLPDVELRLHPTGTQVSIFAGVKGSLRQNNFEAVTTLNPYVQSGYNIQQTHSNEAFAGLQSNIGNHITIAGRLSYWQYDNMLFFLADSALTSVSSPAYDKVNAVGLQASVRYHVADILSIGASGSYTSFSPAFYKYASQEPGIRFTADLVVRPVPQLVITGYLSVFDEMYAVTNGNQAVKMNNAFDLGGGAEYSFIPRLSAFVQVKNILNNSYERWYGYRAYGFNIFGGIRFKF